jgi:hypothetical protein
MIVHYKAKNLAPYKASFPFNFAQVRGIKKKGRKQTSPWNFLMTSETV